jgi:hypothetical protein
VHCAQPIAATNRGRLDSRGAPGDGFPPHHVAAHRSGHRSRSRPAWARALGEFGATITFAGSFPGTTRTMPLEVYLALEIDAGSALLLSVLLLGVWSLS